MDKNLDTDKNLDDEIIEWALKMAHDNPGYFTITNTSDAMVFACFGHFQKSASFECAFKYTKRRHKKNRVSMVQYGLMLYALKRTGYKVSTGDRATDDDFNHLRIVYPEFDTHYYHRYPFYGFPFVHVSLRKYEQAIEPLIPLVIALSQGGDFPTDVDFKDMPLECVIELVKASVPEF